MNNFIKEDINIKPINNCGYDVIKNIVEYEAILKLNKEIERTLSNANDEWLSNNTIKVNDEYVYAKSLDTPSDLLFELGRDSTLIELAETFAQKRVTPLYCEYFNKPAYTNIPTPVHQDHAFYIDHFMDELGVTFWIALEDCNIENGCMHMQPTKTDALLEHKTSESVCFDYEMINQDKTNFNSICLETGDSLLHGSYTPHYCPGNNSSRSRKAIAFSFRTSQYKEQFNPFNK